MDSLGGILIKGLLSNNLIAGFFSLYLSLTVEVTPTPTPSVTLSPSPSLTLPPPTITPTPTPITNVGGGGGSITIGRIIPPNTKDVKITLRVMGKQYTSMHRKSDKVVKVTINIINMFNKIKKSIININIRQKQKKDINIKVKKHDS